MNLSLSTSFLISCAVAGIISSLASVPFVAALVVVSIFFVPALSAQ